MNSPLGDYRIRPGLGACLRWAVIVTGWMLAFLIPVAIAGSWWVNKGLPPNALENLPVLLTIVLLAAVALGVFIYLLGLLYSPSVTREGLRGLTGWRRETITWSEIESIEPTSLEGLPALVIKSSRTRRQLTLMTLGIDPTEIHWQLAQLAGTDHPLTQYFAGTRT